MTTVSPEFPYGGKGTLTMWQNIGPGLPDTVLIRNGAVARRGVSFLARAEKFIVYGDIAKGPIQLASHDGRPMGLVPGIERSYSGRDQLNCRHLQQTESFATIRFDATKTSPFGPSFNCDNRGILICQTSANSGDDFRLFIPDKPPAENVFYVFDVFFSFDLVPGLGRGFDLSYVDLTKAELSGVDLTGANLQHANLTGAKLNGAKLDGAVLANATLTGADLTQAALNGTDLSGANLAGAILSTDLTKAIFKSPPIFHSFVFSSDREQRPSFKNATLNYSLIGLSWTHLDLTGASVIGMPADLTNLNADHVTAPGINLSKKTLVNARFRNATLTGAVLTDAVLDGADLSGAKLEGATLSTDLTKIICNAPPTFSTDPGKPPTFKKARLNYALIGLNWSCLDLTEAAVQGMPAELPGLKATHLTAPGIDLIGKKLVGADFSYAKLANAKLNSAILTGAVLTGADLSGAKLLAGTQLGGAHLDMADLSGADLTGAQLMGAKGVSATLTYAFLANAVLDGANLKGVDFSGATLIETSLKNATSLERANFTGAYLNTVHFAGTANLQGVKFANACLIGCDLTQANLAPSDGDAATLEGAFLQGANFTGVTLTDANLSGAVVSFHKGEIDTYHCDENHAKTEEPRKMRWPSATRVEESVKAGNCICPNGNTYQNNVRDKLTFEQMCQIKDPLPCWTPNRCKPAG